MNEGSGVIQRVAKLGVLKVQESNLGQTGLLGAIDNILGMVIAQDENGTRPVDIAQLFEQFCRDGRSEVRAAIPRQGDLSGLRHFVRKIGFDIQRRRRLVQLCQSFQAHFVERVFKFWGGIGDIKKQLIAKIL